MTDRIAELRSESRDLIALLQRLGDGEHDDLSVAHDALAEIINLRLQRAALLDCAEALKKCLPLLHQNFASNDKQLAHAAAVKALAKLNGESNA